MIGLSSEVMISLSDGDILGIVIFSDGNNLRNDGIGSVMVGLISVTAGMLVISETLRKRSRMTESLFLAAASFK